MTTATERFRSGMSVHTSRAIDALKEGKPGDVISLGRMEQIIERQCGAGMPGYGNVRSAIDNVRSNFGIVWEWDRSSRGWRCLSDSEKPDAAKHRTKKARKQIRRSLAILAATNQANLTADQRQQVAAQTIQLGTVLLFSSDRALKKLQTSGIELRKISVSDKVLDLMKRR